MNQNKRRLLLIQALLKEKAEYRAVNIPAEPENQRQLLRGLMNIRAPLGLGENFCRCRTPICKFNACAAGAVPLAGGYYHA